MTNMVYLPLEWTRVCRWAGMRRLIRRGVMDEGFTLHILLSNVFGKRTLQPFRLFRPSRARIATLYAYTDQGADSLRDAAEMVAPPDCLDVLKLGEMLSKPLPNRFPEGQRLGFDVRVRPIRRLARDIRDTQSASVLRKGSEIDVFRLELLHRSADGWREPSSRLGGGNVSRESAYVDWIAERLGSVAAVDRERCRLADFRRSRVLRGNGSGPEGPDATLHGECVVRDSAGFANTIRRGVGRHRAYGYGMLILRPPGTPPQVR